MHDGDKDGGDDDQTSHKSVLINYTKSMFPTSTHSQTHTQTDCRIRLSLVMISALLGDQNEMDEERMVEADKIRRS